MFALSHIDPSSQCTYRNPLRRIHRHSSGSSHRSQLIEHIAASQTELCCSCNRVVWDSPRRVAPNIGLDNRGCFAALWRTSFVRLLPLRFFPSWTSTQSVTCPLKAGFLNRLLVTPKCACSHRGLLRLFTSDYIIYHNSHICQ